VRPPLASVIGGANPSYSTSTYRADIDGLRGLAVVAVVVFHAFPSIAPGGFVGVDIFFVISGYLISRIVIEDLRRGTFTFSEFYYRRIRRIFPALIAVMLACLALGWGIVGSRRVQTVRNPSFEWRGVHFKF
jgi:peptidoglycan/LPS O-acetylase OafA/YrhL